MKYDNITKAIFIKSKESTCNAGDPGFDSWVRKIHWKKDRLPTPVFLGFPCGSAGKNSPAMQET